MAGSGGADFLLFVAGIPGESDDPKVDSTILRWFLGANAEVRLSGWWRDRKRKPSAGPSAGGPTPSDEMPWHLPPQVLASVQLVCDLVSQAGKHVTLVDVNRSGGQLELVRRWVGDNDVFPLLIRTDGSRVEGIENFTARKIRTFVTGS